MKQSSNAPAVTLSRQDRRLLIKVCGMRYADNVAQVARLDIDMMGFVFWPRSPRYAMAVPPGAAVDRAGVFVDDTPQDILRRVGDNNLKYVQLHGGETPAMVETLRRGLAAGNAADVKIIKALSVSSAADVARYKDYEGLADLFLFDTRCATAGGSGRQFDWDLLTAYDGGTPFLLSGGIGPGDVQRVRQFSHPMLAGIDLNSRFETGPGRKDPLSLRDFICKVRA